MTYTLSTDIHRSEKRFFDRWRIIKNEEASITQVWVTGWKISIHPISFFFFFGVKITVCWVVIYRHTAYRHTLIVQVGTPIRCLVTPDSSGKKGGRNSQIIKKERERKRRRRGEEMKSRDKRCFALRENYLEFPGIDNAIDNVAYLSIF